MSSFDVEASAWPVPVQRVQLLAESGLTQVPFEYVRPHADRPSFAGAAPASPVLHHHDPHGSRPSFSAAHTSCYAEGEDDLNGSSYNSLSIPVLDLSDLENDQKRRAFLLEMKRACETWGFFYVKNHGVEEEVMEGVRSAARQFFKLPMSEKQKYGNDPVTYQGYGSRLGVNKGAVLDWGDYYFLNVLPHSSRNLSKWPTNPPQWRGMVEEYCKQVESLSKKIFQALSMSLGLQEEGEEEAGQGSCRLQKALGEVDMGLRINYYPPCPQPELTLGLSPHSDPGGLTLLLQDHHVAGLQVKAPYNNSSSSSSSSSWVTVPPLHGTLLVNLGDQLQILTNGKYKSVEHRVVANSRCERISLACFLNPGNDTVVAPLMELVPKNQPPAYNAMTFREYRAFIRSIGTNGKGHLESIASPTSSHQASSPLLRNLGVEP